MDGNRTERFWRKYKVAWKDGNAKKETYLYLFEGDQLDTAMAELAENNGWDLNFAKVTLTEEKQSRYG